jgi:hypothetical protein
LSVTLCGAAQDPPAPAARDSAESRAVAYLVREVPRWRQEHACYSCHNNGDAARALLAARGRGFAVDAALAGTLAWLQRPESWEANATDGGVTDKPLAQIQFAGALAAALTEKLAEPAALTSAALAVVSHQRPDGSWTLESSQGPGTPVTYGTALATWAAWRTLTSARDDRVRPAADRAERWIRSLKPENVLDAAAAVLVLASATDVDGRAARGRALDVLSRAQAPDGGWGLYVTSAPEPFDTSVALLALAAAGTASRPGGGADARVPLQAPSAAVQRGREFLLRTQQADGSWPETTRPAGQESYAQRISTTGWATLALFATTPAADPPEPR